MPQEDRHRMMDLLEQDQIVRDSRDRGPVPRPGTNDDFDSYVLKTFGTVDPTSGVDWMELRKAAWRTWQTTGPAAARPSHTEEDDELARALAVSAEEFKKDQGSRHRPIVIDDDDDDDDDLQAALAMSIAPDEPPAKRRRERENTPDEESRLLAEAIAASLEEAQRVEEDEDDSDAEHEKANAAFRASRAASRERQLRERERKRMATDGLSSKAPSRVPSVTSSKDGSPSRAAEGSKPAPSGLGAFGIDRAQLERERLARQAQRSQGGISQPEAGPSSASMSSTGLAGRSNSSASSTRLSNHPLQSRGLFPTDAAGEYYLDGELRHVRLRIGNSTTENTFSPQNVFGKTDQIALLIVSAFCWDPEWIETFLPQPATCPTIRILRPPVSDFNERRSMQGKLRPLGNGEVQIYPGMDGKSGSEHMKFAWIFYKTGRLRVSIMTANMVDYDWEQIENTVFVQDFLPKGQRLGSATSDKTDTLPDFPNQFRRLFAHLKVHKALTWHTRHHPLGKQLPITDDIEFGDFKKYDWNRVQVRLVISVAGTYRGFKEMSQSGICRLGKVLEEEGWQPGKNERVVAEYQGSSLGTYSLNWYTTFYQLCSGKDLPSISRAGKPISWPPLKVIFPSLATVDASINGRPGGGTMFCGNSHNSNTAALFHDANSKRGGVLMHTKMLIALFEPSSGLNFSPSSKQGKRKADDVVSENEGVGGWVYVGSHNFSPSAWGTVNFKNNPETLNINNYELGIVFPLPRGKAQTMANQVAAHRRPARPYSRTDEPWKTHMPP